MLQATGEAKYADLLEKELLNGILPGISQSGTNFFYTNKLRRMSEDVYQMDSRHRTGSSLPELLPDTTTPFPPKMNAQCCPPNYARMLAMSPGLAYGLTDQPRMVWVHLYGSSEIDTFFKDGTRVNLVQEAPDFPWGGSVRIKVQSDGQFGVRLRMPSWARTVVIKCKGDEQRYFNWNAAYVDIKRRNWSAGDTIHLELDMTAFANFGDSRTGSAQTGKVAVQCGPIVYCAERIDNPPSRSGSPFADILVSTSNKLRSVHNDDLDVMALENKEIYLIPYFSWGNRSDDYMTVWLNGR